LSLLKTSNKLRRPDPIPALEGYICSRKNSISDPDYFKLFRQCKPKRDMPPRCMVLGAFHRNLQNLLIDEFQKRTEVVLAAFPWPAGVHKKGQPPGICKKAACDSDMNTVNYNH